MEDYQRFDEKVKTGYWANKRAVYRWPENLIIPKVNQQSGGMREIGRMGFLFISLMTNRIFWFKKLYSGAAIIPSYRPIQ